MKEDTSPTPAGQAASAKEEGAAPHRTGRASIQYADWVKEGVALFGEDSKKWRFKCVKCGHTQSMEDFAGLVEDPSSVVHFSCIGRWKKGVGCNWTLGGLFAIHNLEVVTPDGSRVPAFEFAPEASK